LVRERRRLGELEKVLRLVALNVDYCFGCSRRESFSIVSNSLRRYDNYIIGYVRYPDCSVEVYSELLDIKPVDDEGDNLRFITGLEWLEPRLYKVTINGRFTESIDVFSGIVYVKVYWSEIVEDDVVRGEKMVRLDDYYKNIMSRLDYNILTGYQLGNPRITVRFITDLEYNRDRNIIIPDDFRIP